MNQAGFTVLVPAREKPEDLLSSLSSVGMQTLRKETEAIVCGAGGADISALRAMLAACGVELLEAGDCQAALDAARGEYVLFLPSGDTLNGAFALEILRKKARAEQADVLRAALQLPQKVDGLTRMRPFPGDARLCHGALYRADALRAQNVRLDGYTSEARETGFNLQLRLCAARGLIRAAEYGFQAVCLPWAAFRPMDLLPELCPAGRVAAGVGEAARKACEGGVEAALVRAFLEEELGALYSGLLERQMAEPEKAEAYLAGCRGRLGACLDEPLRPEKPWQEWTGAYMRDYFMMISGGAFVPQMSVPEFFAAIR